MRKGQQFAQGDVALGDNLPLVAPVAQEYAQIGAETVVTGGPEPDVVGVQQVQWRLPGTLQAAAQGGGPGSTLVYCFAFWLHNN